MARSAFSIRDVPRNARARVVALAASTCLLGAAGTLACNTLLGIHGGHLRPTVAQLSAGNAFACALLSDGSVWCWGADDRGQLGHLDLDADKPCPVRGLDGSASVGLCGPTPSRVDQVTNVMQIAAGGEFACALESGGAVKCWGADEYDQLIGTHQQPDLYTRCPQAFFDGGTASQMPCDPVPQTVPLPAPASAIAAGAYHACAITTKGVYCWGESGDGILGGDAGTGQGGGPVLVPGVHGASALSASLRLQYDTDHTCARTGNGGLACWGDNGNMQNGCASTDDAVCPIKLSGVTEVAAGVSSTCALGPGATVQCWGSNEYGTFAAPAITGSQEMPVESQYLQVLGTADAAAATLEGRSIHMLTIDNGGALWGWGDNTYGELALPPDAGSMCGATGVCETLPVPIPLPSTGVRVIATGVDFSVAYTADGTLWAWGANGEGQLGHLTDGGGPCPGQDVGAVPCEWTPSRVPYPETPEED